MEKESEMENAQARPTSFRLRRGPGPNTPAGFPAHPAKNLHAQSPTEPLNTDNVTSQRR